MARIEFAQWDIWEVRWVHEDGTEKPRPALLLSSAEHIATETALIFAKISSVLHPTPFTLTIDPADPEYIGTGLRNRKRSYVYLGRREEVPKDRVLMRRGSLGPRQIEETTRILQGALRGLRRD